MRKVMLNGVLAPGCGDESHLALGRRRVEIGLADLLQEGPLEKVVFIALPEIHGPIQCLFCDNGNVNLTLQLFLRGRNSTLRLGKRLFTYSFQFSGRIELFLGLGMVLFSNFQAHAHSVPRNDSLVALRDAIDHLDHGTIHLMGRAARSRFNSSIWVLASSR